MDKNYLDVIIKVIIFDPMIKKPKILQVAKITVPIYYGQLIVVVTNDMDAALAKYNIPTEGSHNSSYGLACTGYDAKLNVTRRIIFLDTKPTHSVIAHEALHITHGILSDVHIEMDYNNDEPSCYLHDWIIEQVYTGLAKHKIRVYIKNID